MSLLRSIKAAFRSQRTPAEATRPGPPLRNPTRPPAPAGEPTSLWDAAVRAGMSERNAFLVAAAWAGAHPPAHQWPAIVKEAQIKCDLHAAAGIARSSESVPPEFALETILLSREPVETLRAKLLDFRASSFVTDHEGNPVSDEELSTAIPGDSTSRGRWDQAIRNASDTTQPKTPPAYR